MNDYSYYYILTITVTDIETKKIEFEEKISFDSFEGFKKTLLTNAKIIADKVKDTISAGFFNKRVDTLKKELTSDSLFVLWTAFGILNGKKYEIRGEKQLLWHQEYLSSFQYKEVTNKWNRKETLNDSRTSH